MKEQEYYISDCSLRDARHSPGVYIDVPDSVNVAKLLDAAGIDEVEAGIVNKSRSDELYLKSIADQSLKARLSAVYFCLSTSGINEVIDYAEGVGCNSICISIPTSEQFIASKLKRSFRATCSLMNKAVSYAAKKGLCVAFSGEDAARADLDSLIEYIKIGENSGATRFRFAESVSCLEPSEIAHRVTRIKENTSIQLEVHCHSGYGLAVANTLSALNNGATWASVTLGGLGERGGNTPLAPVLLYLFRFKTQTKYDLAGLYDLEHYFAKITNSVINRFTPIVGEDAFSYEILNQFNLPDVYEDYSPKLVGNNRRLVVGTKLDSSVLNSLVESADISLVDLESKIMGYVKKHKKPIGVEGFYSSLEVKE